MNFALLFVLLGLSATAPGAVSYKITLDDLLRGKYIPKYFGGLWISGGSKFGFDQGGDTITLDAATNETQVLIDGGQFNQTMFPGRKLQLSQDQQYTLVTHSARSVLEIFPLAKYHLHQNSSRTTYPLNPPGHAPGNPQAELELVIWSPAGNALAFVYEHNVYFQSGAAQGVTARQVTTNGNATVSNGRASWVFADDIFGGSGNTMGFSPNGAWLAFIRFDETPVEELKFITYGEPGDYGAGPDGFQYPKVQSLRFPKAGTPNGLQSLHVVNVTDPQGALVPLELTYDLVVPSAELHYIATAHWLTPTRLLVVWLTRRQDKSNWFICDMPATTRCRFIWSEQEPEGWITMNPIHISFTGNALLTPSSAFVSGATKSYRHIVKITLPTFGSNGATEDHLDPVHHEGAAVHLDDILGWDEPSSTFYFAGNTELDASTMHVYRVRNITDGDGRFVAECLTCAIVNAEGSPCLYNKATFNTDLSFMFHSCLGPGVPEFVVRRIPTQGGAPGAVVRVMEANSDFRAMIADAELPTQQNYEIPLASGFTARARLFLPPDFDPQRSRPYPLVVEVYAGPETQFNTHGFDLSWEASLTSDRDVVYARIDGSGSSRQSQQQYYRLRNRLGTIEVEDQIEATAWLIQNSGVPIDVNRTAIWGWSNGGYVTAMVLAKDTRSVFKCGIAKAPASSWFLTASITTERHMGMPTADDNLEGYEAVDLPSNQTLLEGFRGKEFLMIHGNADINANYQHSMKLARALQKAGILFSSVSYPDEYHAIDGPGMFYHQYHTFERFLFRDCFGGHVEPEECSPESTTTINMGHNLGSGIGLLIYALAICVLKLVG